MQIVRGALARLWPEVAGKKREATAEPARADRELLRRAQLALERRTLAEPVDVGKPFPATPPPRHGRLLA
jgi:hypothetical protein